MKKKKTLACALVLAAGLLITPTLASCGNDVSSQQVAEKTVTFKVQDENGNWKTLGNPLTITDGKIASIPTAPSKAYYTFRGWFLDTGYVTEFSNENLTNSLVVYAYYIADEVNIYINGESQGTRDLIDVINGTYNPGEGLTFDGWYTNEECSVKYKEGDSAKTLYAQSVATITFDNGYESVYVAKIKPNTTLNSPKVEKVTVDGEEKTIEQASIVKSYMSSEDIYYVDENGNDIDFTKAINKNTTIKVMWKSPFLKYNYGNNTTGDKVLICEGTYGTYKASDYSRAVNPNTVPVVSFPSRVTFAENKDEEPTLHQVKMAYVYDSSIFNSTSIKKVIVQEGVKVIRGFSSVSGTSGVTSFDLPSSLKIIQNCFNNLNLTSSSVSIPNGVEAIYASFFKGGKVNYNNEANNFYTGSAYDFDINVPDSVKSLSIVPLNLKFSSSSSFTNDGKMICQNTSKGKVLVSYNEMNNGVINVPEGIEGIQVGTFVNIDGLKKLVLPKSFKFVNYNLNYEDYKDCYSWIESAYANIECYLYDEDMAKISSGKGELAYNAKLICEKLQDMCYLVFQGDVENSVYQAFGGNSTEYSYYSGNFTSCDNEVYKDIKTATTKETATPLVHVNLTDSFTGDSYSVSINRTSNTPITYSDILEAIDANYNTTLKNKLASNIIEVTSCTNLLDEYDITSEVKSNLYLDMSIDYIVSSAGVIIDTTGEEGVVTGFDQSTALDLGNESYAVIIPDSVDGKKVTKIAADAFKENGYIKLVQMGSNIKEIGDNAFLDAVSLSVIHFNDAKLETIGASAFENTSLTSLSFSIASLKTLGVNAFKIASLKEFVPVDGEENRKATNVKDGEFYFGVVKGYNSSMTALVDHYWSLNQKTSSSTNQETGITTYDVKMYAWANAASWETINIGEYNEDENYIIRVELMEGAITEVSLSDYSSLNLHYVSKIHTNAITSSEVSSEGIQYDAEGLGITGSIKTIQNLVENEAVSSIFETGWIDNYDSIKTVTTVTCW